MTRKCQPSNLSLSLHPYSSTIFMQVSSSVVFGQVSYFHSSCHCTRQIPQKSPSSWVFTDWFSQMRAWFCQLIFW